jgi:hypothetical protein
MGCNQGFGGDTFLSSTQGCNRGKTFDWTLLDIMTIDHEHLSNVTIAHLN